MLLMSNFSGEILLWTIMQLLLIKNVIYYYIHQKDKWMCWMKKLIHFKHLIIETTYTFFSVFS